MRLRETELLYDVDKEGWQHTLLLKEARKKLYKVWDKYKEEKNAAELLKYRREVCLDVCVHVYFLVLA